MWGINMDQEQGRALMVVVMLIVFGLSVGVLGAKLIFQGVQDFEKYKQEEKVENEKIFATRNKDYKDLTQEDSTQIILEFSEYNSKDANLAVMNYISNINGKLLSINGKSIPKSTLKPVVGGMYGQKGGLGLGLGFSPGIDVTTKNVYVLLVPKDAKFADNLQERMDRYLKYKDR